MPVKFDSRPLVLRRAYTATMRATTVLEWRDQVNHGLHLFFIIASSVVARNVANQQLLDAPPPAGPESLGTLYAVVAVLAGVVLAGLGWFARSRDTRAVASVCHLAVAVLMGACFVLPGSAPYLVIGKYVAMEVAAAVLLLVFGLMLGARMGPREARRIAARVGAGGIAGGLLGGAILGLGAKLVGSRDLFLIAAAMAVAPVFWLPTTQRGPGGTVDVNRDRADVPQLRSYGWWVMATTLLMVATTTLIDYEYRFAAKMWLRDDDLTSFFGMVVILAGVTSILFQLTALDKILDKLGLFATATIMPGALIICSAVFGLLPGLYTLMVLKLVDSGANMSVQQATGGLLLAPLGVRARSVWQGRIDGLAKRGGQLLTGVFLAAYPWPPARVLPVSLVLCALWVFSIGVTRTRYVRLLTAMLSRPPANEPEVQVYDGGTLRLLERELATADPARAAVILDLLEQAEHRAPDPLLKALASRDNDGKGALLVIDHLGAFDDTNGLVEFTKHVNPRVAGEALMALDEVNPAIADSAARALLRRKAVPNELRALAAGLLAGHDPEARLLVQKLAVTGDDTTRRALAQALGRLEPGSPPEIGQTLCALASDPNPEIARVALGATGKHLSPEACNVALQALENPRLRGAGMRALAELGPPVVRPVAEQLARRRDDPNIAAALTWALGHIGVANAVPALVSALEVNHTNVRLSAAVALNVLARRRPNIDLPHEAIAARYVPEIEWYGQLRDVSLCALPNSPTGVVLRHSVRQRAHASIETLFRLLALRYPEDSISGAFAAINSRDKAQRQLALELLDTLLEPPVRRALADAVGEVGGKPRVRDRVEALQALARRGELFVSELASLVLEELDGRPARTASRLLQAHGMRGSFVDQILELQSISLFSQASAEDLGEVAQLVSDRTVSAGTVLFREGDVGDAMYLIREGSVVLTRGSQTVDRLGPGDALGIVAVLDRLPRELTATTTSETSLLVIKASDLQHLLADRPLLMHSIFRALTASIRGQLDRVALGKRRSRAEV